MRVEVKFSAGVTVALILASGCAASGHQTEALSAASTTTPTMIAVTPPSLDDPSSSVDEASSTDEYTTSDDSGVGEATNIGDDEWPGDTIATAPQQTQCDPMWGCVTSGQFAGSAATGGTMWPCRELETKVRNAEDGLRLAEENYQKALELKGGVNGASQLVQQRRESLLMIRKLYDEQC